MFRCIETFIRNMWGCDFYDAGCWSTKPSDAAALFSILRSKNKKKASTLHCGALLNQAQLFKC